MSYLLIWLFIIGEAIVCESQYAPPDKQHWAEVLDLTSPSVQPTTQNNSKLEINEHNSNVTIEELIQSTTAKEFGSLDDEIATTVPLDNSTAISVDNSTAILVDNSTAISVDNSTAISVDNSTAISVDNLTENSEISVDNSTANFVIKDESLRITTLRPDDDEFSTVVATTKGTVKVTLDATLNTNITSDALKTSHVSLPTSSKGPTKETTSVPKKGADPSLLHPSVVPKKEADPSSLYPSVVGKKGADPSSIKPSATGRKGADPTSLIPSVHARKGVDFKTGESLQKSTNPIEVLNKTDEFNTKEENKSNETTQQATSVDLKSSVTISNESDKKISSNPSSAVPSLGTHKYTPVIKPVPVSTDGSSIEELEVPSTVANIHMKPTAATDLLGKNLEIEMVVEEESSSNSGIIIGVILLVTVVMAVIFMGYRHFKEVWMKRHYSRMDFLIDGMYDM